MYYRGLDLVRFLAASLVVMHHIGSKAWMPSAAFTAQLLGKHVNGQPLIRNGWAGWVGVQIFFVISGVVIANSAHGRTPFEFVKGRLGRLVPAAIICAPLAGLIIFAVDAPISHVWLRVALSMFLSPLPYWVDPVLWTLSVELAFYGLVLVQIWRGPTDFKGLATGLTIWSGVWFILIMAWPNMLQYRWLEMVARPLLLRHGCFFAVGLFIWLWSSRKMTAELWIVFAGAIFLSGAEIWIKTGQDMVAESAKVPWLPLLLWLVSFGAIAASVLFASSKRPSPLTRRIGALTYPLYLCHTTVAIGVMYLLLETGSTPWVSFFAGVVSALGAAWLISHIEPHMRRFIEASADCLRSASLAGATSSLHMS